jgi:hypothetical protein
VNAGSYTVVATPSDPGYTGSATATMVISKAWASIVLTELSAVYDGTPKAVVVTTSPAGIPFALTYAGSTMPPTNAGSYSIAVTLNDPNYQGTKGGTLVIAKAPVQVNLSGLSATYDGTPKAVTVTTVPSPFTTTVTYKGLATPPTMAGSYPVTATIVNSNYQGSASGTLVISKLSPTVIWAKPADIVYPTALSSTQFNATASVPGTFSYSPPAGTVLPVGTNQPLSVTFTPADAVNYSTVAAGTSLTVKAP